MASAFEMPIRKITVSPKADISAKRYHFVTLDNTGKAILATAESKAVVGVLDDEGGKDIPSPVTFLGATYVVCSGKVEAGDPVAPDADGKAKKAEGAGVGICIVGGDTDKYATILLK